MKNPRQRVSEAWKPGRREEKKLLLWILLGSPQMQPKGTAGLLGSQSTIKTVINHKLDLERASEVN